MTGGAKPSIENRGMTKQEYQAECLLRNPGFREMLLAFRQTFPVLFNTAQLPGRALGGFLGSVSTLPHLELRVYRPSYVALIPKQLGDHFIDVFSRILHWFGPSGTHRLITPSLVPWDGEPLDPLERYCSVLGKAPSEYQEVRARLVRLYPQLSDSVGSPSSD